MAKLTSKEIWSLIVDSLDTILIFFLSIYTLYITISGQPVPENRISALTVAILASLAFSLFRDRFNGKKLEKSLSQIPISQNLSMRFRGDYKEIVRSLITNSKKSIWIIVRTGSIIYETKLELEDALKRGCKLKIVVCQSNNDDLIKIIELDSHHNQEKIKSMFKDGNNAFEYLQKKYPKLIERKIIGFTPPQLMYITDTNDNSGESNSTAFIIPFAFKSSARLAPSIKFKFNEDPTLFEYYFEQINRLWDYKEDDYSKKNI